MKVFEVLQSAEDITIWQIKNHKELAKKLGLSVKELTKMSDKELEVILKNIGKHDFVPDSDFDPKELAMGIKVEREHTSSDLIALLITKDHLKENSRYYTHLEKMEKSFQKK